MFDSCSQPTLVSDTFVNRFNLRSKKSANSVAIKGVGSEKLQASSSINITILSRFESFELDFEADIVPASSLSYAVNHKLPNHVHEQLRRFSLADDALLQANILIQNVDILLSAEYYERCMCNETRKIESLGLRLTHFGWVATGAAPKPTSSASFCGLTINEINENLQKFWRLEEPATTDVKKSEANDCVTHFNNNVRITEKNKFEVRLPFKVDKDKIADNYNRAFRAFLSLEKRLAGTEEWKEYSRFIREFIELDHMEPAEPNNNPKYYIPHREVIRKESATTPLRVVFNASSHGKDCISLNEGLMVGPQIQRDLFDILISARIYKYWFTADIQKMYRMIEVNEKDRDMQRVLWRENKNEPIRVYRSKTLAYGTSPASFIAQNCLHMIAEKIEDQHPVAAKVIKTCFYMDDIIAGCGDENELIDLQKTIHEALAKHHFILRKYSSNSTKLLETIPESLRTDSLTHSLTGQIGVLGVKWLTQIDAFGIKIDFEKLGVKKIPTKRSVLSFTSLVFDPLGLVSPVTLRGKTIMQSLWIEEVSEWDVPIPQNLQLKFIEYMNDIKSLTSFSIPRSVTPWDDSVTQLILFCDASETAYGAVIYIRSVGDLAIKCRMLCSKTHVAPIKSMAIAKLELCSALLGSKLVARVASTLNISEAQIHAFTDNTTVLCWLSKDPSNWKTFVENRARKILEIVPFVKWSFVPTHANPADLITRGITADEFEKKKHFWIDGPDFLMEANAFSYHVIPNLDVQNALEKRKTNNENVVLLAMISYDFWKDFSSLPRLIRVVAYILRFGRKQPRSTTVISTEEYNEAFRTIIAAEQISRFPDEVTRVQNNLQVRKKSPLRTLNPVIMDDSLLRVGGRLQHSNYSFQKKKPIILSAKSHIAKLLIRHVHEKYFHCDRLFLSSFFSSGYWFLGGRSNAIKHILYSCVACARVKAKPCEQIMGQLPISRVTVSRPFKNVGVDLAGYFMCKCVNHRSVKMNKIYLAVFVCFVTRAVHLEIVSDLTAEKFCLAIDRFTRRRGTPSDVYSDNATNFLGFKNFLDTIKPDLVTHAASAGFNWHFIPPSSPNFGGLWEAAVKSSKKHIIHVTHGNALTFEEYITLFARVEAILNSRPLCSSLSSEQGTEVITPAHFLIGESILSLPCVDEDNCKSLSHRLQLMKNQLRSFWRIWSKDYLNLLQSMHKWTSKQQNLTVGNMVLVKDDDTPPFKWPLGRVESVHVGSDGAVRVAEVRFKNTVRSRAISKLIPLPIDT